MRPARAQRLSKDLRQVIHRLLRGTSLPEEQITAGLAVLDGSDPKGAGGLEPLAVPQARLCELLSCSRHHVRKLERQGILKPVILGGLKRYPMKAVLELLGGAS